MLVTACSRHADPADTGTTSPAASQGVVDSIFPVEEEIRRFRLELNGATAERLEHSAPSRDELVNRLIGAIERTDSAEIGRLMISAAEFLDLFYPDSPYARPPFRQNPAFVWFQIGQNSEKGIGRAVQRYGGRPANFSGYDCDPEPEIQGTNRLWNGCRVHWKPTADAAGTLRLFGTIIEREGRYKFVSYANDL